MESLHHQVALLVPDEKPFVFELAKYFFFKTNEASFIRDLYCHVADDGSHHEKFFGLALNCKFFSISCLCRFIMGRQFITSHFL